MDHSELALGLGTANRRFLIHGFFFVSIIAKLEKLAELKVALVVHQLLSLGEHNDDEDKSVAHKDQTVNVEPVLLLFRVRYGSQAVDVDSNGGEVYHDSLKNCESTNQPEITSSLCEASHKFLLAKESRVGESDRLESQQIREEDYHVGCIGVLHDIG